MEDGRASSTAVIVCQGRAVAHERIAIGRFDDPIAIELLRDAERLPVEVDHPASQRDKIERLGSRPSTVHAVHFVPVDFTRDDLGSELQRSGHSVEMPTIWVWEGVVPYLTVHEVDATLAMVDARSAPGSRIIVNYQAPALSDAVGRAFARVSAAATRRVDPWNAEPRRSSWTPKTMRSRLTAHGFGEARDDDLMSLAAHLGVAVRNRRSLRSGRVAVADRAGGPGPG